MTRLALCVTIAAALAAILAASLHASPAVAGWLAALAAFAFAAAAGGAARALHAPDDLREPREAHARAAFEPLPVDAPSRRSMFGRLWWYAAGTFALAGIVPFVALARRPVRRGTAWFPGARVVTADGTPLRPDDVAQGGVETVFPQGRPGAPQSAAMLVRVQRNLLPASGDPASPTPNGNIAYSKICTHAGCPVALYRKASYQLYCPCHQSMFDVLNGARPVAGPATRALPQLALGVDADGFLIARGDFSEPVGPDDWWRAT